MRFDDWNNADIDMKTIESIQHKILAKAAEQGLKVSGKQVRYIGETGRHYVRSMLLGPIAGTFISTARGDIQEVTSLKIKVRE